jgi:predicted RNase H-like nuclease (RuvC/YqgF family)
MGVATAILTQRAWMITLGIIGYLLILLFEAGLDPRSLIRMHHAEQENRSMHAERSRLIGSIKELEARNASLEVKNEQLQKELNTVKADLEKLNQSDQHQ